MRVLLAGFNVDAELVEEAARRGIDRERLTPETLSAAYARISRNPAPVDELRRQARQEVAQARASNERIVFGLGHASVAEHAVLNFDLIGLSRLAIEAVEHARLCSYTEKSQRYIRLQDEVVLPEEITALGLAEPFGQLIKLQCETYGLLYERLRQMLLERHPELGKKAGALRTLEGWAKEDARYVTSLAVEGQLGMTANARSLELMIRRLAGHPLAEVRQLAARLNETARQLAPSLIRYTEPAGAGSVADELVRLASELLPTPSAPVEPEPAVRLVSATPQGDSVVLAGLLHGAGLAPLCAWQARAQALDDAGRQRVIGAVLQALAVHDAPPRAFELASCSFDLVVSSSCFAQLKRHRMATLLAQPYDPALGTTLPPSIVEVGLADAFARVMEQSERLYEQLRRENPAVAPYVLTQAHRRRVHLQLNARELYHFSRLRQDAHAQWDIRQLADQLVALAQAELPLSLALACGKDSFNEARERLLATLADQAGGGPCSG